VFNPFSQNELKQKWVQVEKWIDINGDFINTHGAGILMFNKKYYLYGEIKSSKPITVADRSWDISPGACRGNLLLFPQKLLVDYMRVYQKG